MRRQGQKLIRIGFAAALALACLPPARAQRPSSGVRVVFGSVPLPVLAPDRAPYRSPDDGEVLIAPESLAPMGITFNVGTAGRIYLTGPDGVTGVFTARSGPAMRGLFISATEAIEGLGGRCQWDAGKNILYAHAVLTEATLQGEQVRLRASFPLSPRLTYENSRKRLVIELPGADIGSLPKVLTPASGNVSGARLVQSDPNNARLIVELKKPATFQLQPPSAKTQMALGPATATRPAPAPPRPVTKTARASGAPAVLSDIRLDGSEEGRARFVLQTSRATPVRARLQRDRFLLEFPNATTSAHWSEALVAMNHPLLRAIRASTVAGAARLTIDLARAAGFALRLDPRGGMVLDLAPPRSEDGPLTGKVIVVDAGHGGDDSGARAADGSREKENALVIAQMLAEELQSAGANVILTRDSDAFVPLGERSFIANRSEAHLFVSVHCDSGDRNHEINGSTVYYHMDDPLCRGLAQAVATRLHEIEDIKNRGTRSDSVRFPRDGFSVLRRSQMAAILVETGYMSHRNDSARLKDPATRRKIAAAIAAGVIDFSQSNPDTDTRHIRPQADGGGTLPVLPDDSEEKPTEP